MSPQSTNISPEDAAATVLLHVNFLGFYAIIPAALIFILNMRIITRYVIRTSFSYDKTCSRQSVLIFCRYSADIQQTFWWFLDASLHLYMRVCPSICPCVRMSFRPLTSRKNRRKQPLRTHLIARSGLFFFFNITQLTSAAKRNRSKVDSSNRNSQAAERHPKSDYNISGENTLEAFHTRHDLKRAKC